MPSAEPRQRLFFALWPDESLRQELERILTGESFKAVTGRQVAPENYHITLRYLGPLTEAQQSCVEQVADALRGENFQLTLDKVGYWPGPRVAWLGTERPPIALEMLVKALERGLVSCGFEPERRPFQPHLTFLRKALPKALPTSVSPIAWPVDRFALVRSRTLPEGVQYDIVRSWSFDGTVK